MSERTATVNFEQGLHARPAALLVKAVREVGVPIEIAKDGKKVNAASTLMLMALGVTKGDQVVLSSDAPGADDALASIAELLETGDAS